MWENIAGAKRYSRPRVFNIAGSSAAVVPTPLAAVLAATGRIAAAAYRITPARTGCSLFTHTHPFNGPLSGTTRVSQYRKGKTNLDCTEATDSEWQWHQLGHMQVCTSLHTDNHGSTPTLLQAGCRVK